MITLFCLRRVEDAPPRGDLLAMEGQPVRLVEVGPLGAWVCDGELPRGLTGIRTHDAVVRSALRSATPLPARFATVFSSLEGLVETLRQRQDEFLSDLKRVEGKVEMALRVGRREGPEARVGSPAERGEVHSGREYLEARRRELAEVEAARALASTLLDAVEAAIEPDAFEVVHQLLPEPGVVGVMAHLVHRHGVGEYRTRVEKARSVYPDLDLHLTGPWAPYSFV